MYFRAFLIYKEAKEISRKLELIKNKFYVNQA